MNSVSQVLNTKYEILSTYKDNKQVLSTKYLKIQDKKTLSSIEVQERALLIAGALADEQWTGWYCKAFKTLGEGRYTAVAKTALTGNNPKTLFGWLLKQELAKR